MENTAKSHDFHEVKEWLKQYLVRREMTEALKKRVVEGKVDLTQQEQADMAV